MATATRKKKLMGLFHEFAFKVEGEILAVEMPYHVIMKFPKSSDFVNSQYFESIMHVAAWMGTDEIHLNCDNPEFPCFVEATLKGNEDGGAGYFVISWGDESVRNKKD